MKPPHNYPESLGEWLALSTDGLAGDVRERVISEIQAHHAEAVESLMAGGMTKEDAELRALRDLGDVQRAAENFRKAYLTKKEIQWLTHLEIGTQAYVEARPGYHVKTALNACCVTAMVGVLCWALAQPNLGPWPYVLMASSVQWLIVCYSHWRKFHVMKKITDRFRIWRELIALQFLEFAGVLISGTAIVIAGASSFTPAFYWGLVFYLFSVIGFWRGRTGRIWLKLRNALPRSIPAA